ncbi:MAG: DUF3343 domain-containing protein [Clostridia bacterium]|nr:DUF3343 domain-containing protein [Clostridia bacterium]
MKIRIGSVTYAMKARELLRSYGIDASISKDLRVRGGGCVYVISFSEQYRESATEILRQAGFDLNYEQEREPKP